MRAAIAHPCIGSSASAFRMRRSSVPWTRSTGFIGSDYLQQCCRLSRARVAQALREQMLGDEPDVGGTLGEAAHVPREPVLAVGDQHAQRLALPRELLLQPALDAVEHRELVCRFRHFELPRVRLEAIDEL